MKHRILTSALMTMTFGMAAVVAASQPAQRDVSSLDPRLSFEANEGQSDPQVRFLARGDGYVVFLTADEAVLLLSSPVSEGQSDGERIASDPAIVRLKFPGSHPNAPVAGEDEIPGRSHYFFGTDPQNWHSDIPRYAKVRYSQIRPGVDLVFYGNQGELEFDFVLDPGTDPALIELAVEGGERLSLDSDGNLLVHVGFSEVTLRAPVSYQLVDGVRKEISGQFLLEEDQKVGFEIAAYDPTEQLFIDPVLDYSTFFGGSSVDWAEDVAVDDAGNIYFTGTTYSTNFPTASPAQAACAPSSTYSPTGCRDAFVTKLGPDGQLLYSTYLGGGESTFASTDGYDTAHGIVVDGSGNAYVTGETRSFTFPTTAGAFRTTCWAPTTGQCVGDVFVAKLNSSGALVYATLWGGDDTDVGYAIGVNGAGNAYVTGYTNSADNPATTSVDEGIPTAVAWYATCRGGTPGPCQDAFYLKLSSDFSSLVQASYHGGSGNDAASGIYVDYAGDAWLAGTTTSSTFLTTSGAWRTTCSSGAACSDGFVTKIRQVGGTACTPVAGDGCGGSPAITGSYSTFLGGENVGAGDIDVDASGNAYVTGSGGTIVTTTGAYDTTHDLGADTFVMKLNPAGSDLLYSTYIGGRGDDSAGSIAVDDAGAAYVAGRTTGRFDPGTGKLENDFPTLDAFQDQCGRDAGGNCTWDAFVSALNPDGSALRYSSYLGGEAIDQAHGIATQGHGNAYIVGRTDSCDFPTTPDAYAAVCLPVGCGICSDAFVVAIRTKVDLRIFKTDTPDPVGVGGHLNYNIDIFNDGPDVATGVTLVDPFPASMDYHGYSITGGSCEWPDGTNTGRCTFDPIPPGGYAGASFFMTPLEAGTFVNTASVSSSETDMDPSNNSDSTTTTVLPDNDGDGFADNVDCDDDDATVYPGAPQICDGQNNDCDDNWPTVPANEQDSDGDGSSPCEGDCDDSVPTCLSDCVTDTDGDGTPDCADQCLDADGDGYGSAGGAGNSCSGTDCNDADSTIHPGAPELCNDAVDNDCNVATPDIFDGDLDGYTCVIDCDDTNPFVNPGAAEVCGDLLDNDCNPTTPDVFDGDQDTFACDVDCDDSDATVNPGATEVSCDGIDNDCDAATPDVFDADSDGYACDTDCNDGEWLINPGAAEVSCDGADNDCDGATPDVWDADGDGYSCDVDCDDGNAGLWDCNTPCCGPTTIAEGDHSVTIDVTAAGDTTVTAAPCDPALLDGFLLTTASTPCLTVTTDAGWTEPAEVCITYDDTGMSQSQEEALQMFSCDGSVPPVCDPVPLTPEPPDNPDTVANRVCGLTEHFSIIALGEALDTDNDGTPDLLDNCPTTWNLIQTDSDADGYGDSCDCGPTDPTSYPGGVEFCDGADNDCDTTIDEACLAACDSSAELGDDAAVTSDLGASGFASTVWTGIEYGVAWHDDRNADSDGNWEIYFARLDASGNKIGSDIRVTYDTAISGGPSLVWTGSEYGLAWRDTRDGNAEIYFCRLDAAGNKIGEDRRITYAPELSSTPSLVWTGKEYGVAWHDERDENREIYFARLHPSGKKISSDIRVTVDDALSEYPSLVWTGERFAMSWHDERDGNSEIYLARLDPLGTKDGSDIRITNDGAASEYPSLIWAGSGYGVVWHDNRDATSDGNWEIYFTRLLPSGTKIASDLRLTNDTAISSYPSLVWTGSEYGVAWHDHRFGDWEVYHAIVNPAGVKVSGDIQVSSATSGSYAPSLVWTGSEYGAAWHDDRDGTFDIYFSRVWCCTDADSDGFTVCENDCDDGNSGIHPLASEVCDGVDNNCDATVDEGFLTPGPIQGLRIADDKTTIRWDVEPLADRYEVLKGDLVSLRQSAGDFTVSLTECLESDSLDAQSADGLDPGSGQGFYYLARALRDCKLGTCDTGHPAQQESRDVEIDASGNSCP